MYKQLETRKGQKCIYKVTKQRSQNTRESISSKFGKGQHDNLIYKDNEILSAWHQY